MSHKEIIEQFINENDDGSKLQAHVQAELDQRKKEVLAQGKDYFLKNLFQEPKKDFHNDGNSLQASTQSEVVDKHNTALSQDKELTKVTEVVDGHGNPDSKDKSIANYDKQKFGKGVREGTEIRFKVTYKDGDREKMTYVNAESEVEAKRRFIDNTGKASDIVSVLATKEGQ